MSSQPNAFIERSRRRPVDPSSTDQLDFNFHAPVPDAITSDGLDVWRERRREKMRETARRHGLPLGHRVRLEFKDGPFLEGILLLDESTWHSQRSDHHVVLRIDNSTFHHDEISTCVRLD